MTLKTIAQFLRGGEAVSIKLERDGADGVRVLVTTVLAKEDENADERVKQIRALLARPIFLRGQVEKLDTELEAVLERAAGARIELATTYESLIAELQGEAKTAATVAANKPAKNTAAKPGKQAAATPKSAAAVAPAEGGEEEDDETGGATAEGVEVGKGGESGPPAAQPTAQPVDLFEGAK